MRQFSRSFIAIFLLGSLLGNALPLLAQTRHSLSFIPPDDHVGEPSNTGGGGSRSGTLCSDDFQEQIPLTILAPKLPQRAAFDVNIKVLRGGLTANSFPSLFVYLPRTKAKLGEFVLLELIEGHTYQEVHYSKISLPEQSGIMRFSLPIALEEGKTYEWYFSLICSEFNDATEHQQDSDEGDFSANPVVAGKIERIPLPEELVVQIENASLETKIGLYGKAGLWYDFFALLTEGIPRSPQLQEAWQTSLIGDIDPDAPIFRAPFLSCCSLPPEGE